MRLGWWTTGLLTPSGLQSLILPVLTLGFFQLTLIMRLVRSEMLEVMRADFIRFARARGIPNRTIEFRHALRNTMIPVVTIAGLQLGSVIAFVLYFKLAQRAGAAKAALMGVVIPVIALAVSAVLEGWQVTGLALVGMGLCLGSVVLAQRAPR